jgi:phosphoesterase RecJ-like protein
VSGRVDSPGSVANADVSPRQDRVKAPAALLAAARSGSRFLITSHVSPDGDSVGTSLGLQRILEGLGKTVTVWHRDLAPAVYRSLTGAERIHVGSETPALLRDGAVDWLVALECPTPDRHGLAGVGELPTINLDHHRGNSFYGQAIWVDEEAPAVGEMVAQWARDLGAPLDRDTANLLYLALHTDTGGFRFANATARAFGAAARLIDDGAQPEVVAGWLYERRPLASVRLLADAMATLSIFEQGRVATVDLTPEMFARAGATGADSDGIVDLPRSIAGVEAVALLRDLGDGTVKLSLRSRGDVDVETIARAWGGGGHKNAAGCTRPGTPATLRPSVVAALAAALAAHRTSQAEGS